MFGYFFGIFPSSLLLVVYFAYWLLIDEIWNSIVTVLNFVAVMLTCSLLKHKFQVICTLLIFTFGYLEFEIWPAVVSSIVIGIVLLEIKHFFDIGQYVYYYFPFISYLISPDRYLWVWFSGCTISLIRIWKMPLIWILLAIGLMKVCKYIEHGGASRASEPGKLRNDKTRVSGDQKPLMSHNLYSTNHLSVNNYDTRNIDVLNQLILKLWDHIQFYISKKISNFQKPLYRSGPFIVKDIYCGTVPFKIESIKILDAGLNRKIEVDVDVS